MALSWRPLNIPRSAEQDLPPLLVSAFFNSESYEIHITDLSHIWGETLDRRGIIRRSQDEATSIDASDASQFGILLDKIKLGLEGKKGTRSTLAIQTGTGRPEITIRTTVDLPGGLSPLEWPIHLAAEPESSMTSQLTIPLLEAQHAHVQQLSSLTDVLRDKDHVIQKLLDKVEEQGTQLGQIFPQAAGRGARKVDRAEAAKKVKGLGQFDLDIWRNDLDIERSPDMKFLIGKVFGDEMPKGLGFQAPIQTTFGATTWWENVRGKTINLSTESSVTVKASTLDKAKRSSKIVLKTEDSGKDDDDDDFQVQVSQSHPEPPKGTESKQIDDESTDDDDDDDLGAVSQRSKLPDSFPSSPPAVPSPKPKKLGMIGGRKPVAKSPPKVEDDTTDDASSPARDPSPEEQPPPVPVPKKKGGLGRIGGKKEPPPAPKEPRPPPPSPPPAETTKPKKGRLGKIGGKKKAPVDPAQDENPSERATTPLIGEVPKKGSSALPFKEQGDEVRGRSLKVEKEETPLPRETSEERADRKRQQLKRELEAKAKAPVKKKRKF